MIPVEMRGFSFKGVMAYLANSKRGKAEVPKELRRMVFTMNMEEFNPRSWKEASAIMACFAREDVRRGLMESAVVRGRGGAISLKPPVYHLVLAFPDGTKPNPKQVRGTVREALSALEGVNGKTLADHQYAFFLHQDTGHWHAHVVVNLVDHRTGRLADPYRSQQKLQSWAYRWCKENGFDVCPERQKKYDRIEANKAEAKRNNSYYSDHAGYKNLRGDHYYIHREKKRQGIQSSPGANDLARQRIPQLKSWAEKRYKARREEIDVLYQWRLEKKAAIRAKCKPLIKDATALRKNPLPFTMDARQQAQRRAFFRRERSLSGRLINAGLLAWDKREKRFWESYGHYLMHADVRRMTLFQKQYTQRQKSRRVQKIKEKERAALAKIDRKFAERYRVIKIEHALQRKEESQEWKLLNDARFKKNRPQGFVHQATAEIQQGKGPDRASSHQPHPGKPSGLKF